jgi:hypothetical protein
MELLVLAFAGVIILLWRKHATSRPVPPFYKPALSVGALSSTRIAGAPHYIGKLTSPQVVFACGQLLESRREPDNPYDRLAIALYLRGRKIGYVPRVSNRCHAAHMDAGGNVSVIVEGVDDRDAWRGISITVRNV